jgi:DNA-binding NarL/FixJ family response regulator
MLHGSAVARSDQSNRGLDLLSAVAYDAAVLGADRAVRAEIDYYQALACWTKRDYRDAARFAVQAERASIDVISVRATQLRGFIAFVNTRYAEALELFRRAHHAYALCRGRDIDLATQVLLQIAALEQTLRSAAVPGSHASPGGRTLPGSLWGPAVSTPTRLLLCYNDAWLYAHDGDDRNAFHKAREAEDLAETPAWRVWALAARAIIATVFNERAAGREFADQAHELSRLVDWNATVHEERVGLLQLAEVYAYLAPELAGPVLATYDAVTAPMSSLDVLRERERDPRLVAWDTYVRGLVLRCNGDTAAAAALLRKAAELFSSCGYLWRKAHVLIELDATDAETQGNPYLETAAAIIRENFSRSFLAHRLGRWARVYFDPVAMTLTPAQRDVLRQLLGGLSVRAIAIRTNRSAATVGQHVKRIHQAFETHSIGQLFHECNRRGIGAPGSDTEH